METNNTIQYFDFDATRVFYNQIVSEEVNLATLTAKLCAIVLPIFALLEAIFDLAAFPIVWVIRQLCKQEVVPPPPIQPLPEPQKIDFEELVELVEARGLRTEAANFAANMKADFFDGTSWDLESLIAQIEIDLPRLAVTLNGKPMTSLQEIFEVLGLEPAFMAQPSTSSPTPAQEKALKFLCLLHQGIFGPSAEALHEIAISKKPNSGGVFAAKQNGTKVQGEVIKIITTVGKLPTLKQKTNFLNALFRWLSKNGETDRKIFANGLGRWARFNPRSPEIYRSEEFIALLFHAIQTGALPGKTSDFFKDGARFRMPYDIRPTRIHAFFEDQIQNIIAEQDYAIVEIIDEIVETQPLLMRMNYDGEKGYLSWELHPTIRSNRDPKERFLQGPRNY